MGETSVDGTQEREIFKRYGDLLWDHPMGESLAISPVSNLVAFQTARDRIGTLEIWDVAKATGHTTGIKAADSSLWWMPDGKELIYVGLVAPNQIPGGEDFLKSPFGKTYQEEYAHWDNRPVICAFDVEKGKTRMLLPGNSPLLSSDGTRLLTASRNNWLIMDLKTHKLEALSKPDSWEKPLFLLPNNIAIFPAPPTEGTESRWLERGSFKAGSQMWSIKIGELGTWRFQTILPYADFRDKMSFGVVEQN